MRHVRSFHVLLLPSALLLASLSATAQESERPDYPTNKPGILIGGTDWSSMQSEMPAKFHVKNGLAPVLTYGIAPGKGVSEYAGVHAAVAVEPGRPTICICRILSIPGEPVIVRLHPTKKDVRELDAGKIHVGAKLAKAEAADLVPADVLHPEDTVWLVTPRMPLGPGEYALMLGTQNMAIYSFTVGAPGTSAKP